MRVAAALMVAFSLTDSASAKDCNVIAAAEFKAAMDSAMTYLTGTYACAPLIGDQYTSVGRMAVSNVLQMAGFDSADVTLQTQRMVDKAERDTRGKSLLDELPPNVERQDVEKACYQILEKALVEHEVAIAKFEKACTAN